MSTEKNIAAEKDARPARRAVPSWVWKVSLAACAAIWGGSFVVMKDTLDVIPPAWLMGIRFAASAIIVGALFWRTLRDNFDLSHLAMGAILGVASGSAFVVQNIGLDDTTPGRNAFLTATYCVMVPFINWAVTRRRPAANNLVAALDDISLNSIPFAVAFIVAAVVFSFVWGYIAIKPIMTDYVKQKDFINDMSHEIRTPLAVIKGNLENVLASPDATVAEQSEMLYQSLDEVDYMTDISSGLLNIVRGKSAGRSKETKMSDVVSETVDMFADMATMANKALIANIEYCDIAVDREKIKQLASVLIENAVKYTREGDRISVRLKNTKDGCVFTVADTGIGVPKAELESIFDRFYRAGNVKDVPGTGLGLSIAKAIVEGMGGTIKASACIPCGLEITCVFKKQ